jgi:hypothetical protein
MVTLHDCSGAYTDRSMTPPYTLGLEALDGTVRGVSSRSTAGAEVEISGKLVKSPFRLLGKLGGGKQDADYRYVEFEASSAELRPNALEKLRALAVGAAPDGPSLDAMVSLAGDHISGEQIAVLREQSMTAGEDGGQLVLDETKYYRALRKVLLTAQTIEPAELATLAGARAESIHALLPNELGANTNRLRLLEPSAVDNPSKDRWVRLELGIIVTD